MANVTDNGNHTTSPEFLCSVVVNGMHQIIFLTVFNILISITAFLGNVLIIVALPKVSSLHPPSKLLLYCLVSTDLAVGLIIEPIYITYLLSPENSQQCVYGDVLTDIIPVVFCGVSIVTLTAISVDRLLALMLGLRYRHVVTLGRVRILVVLFWIVSSATALTHLYNDFIVKIIVCIGLLLCIVISTFCYIKIYLTLRHHQVQAQDNLQQGQMNEGRNKLSTARYKKTVYSALWLQITFVACYLPFGVAAIVVAVTRTYPPSVAFFWVLTFSVLMLNSSLNPILYCWRIREVSQAVKETIRNFLCLSG